MCKWKVSSGCLSPFQHCLFQLIFHTNKNVTECSIFFSTTCLNIDCIFILCKTLIKGVCRYVKTPLNNDNYVYNHWFQGFMSIFVNFIIHVTGISIPFVILRAMGLRICLKTQKVTFQINSKYVILFVCSLSP